MSDGDVAVAVHPLEHEAVPEPIHHPVAKHQAIDQERPPLDPRVLAHVIESFEGETRRFAACDVPVYHGQGTLVFRAGFTYTGGFMRGRMHGQGKMTWLASGVEYEGEFQQNEISGVGTFRWPNGSSYVGDVCAGRRHGRGVFCTGTRGSLRLHNDDNIPIDELEGPDDPAMPMLFSYELNDPEASVDVKSGARYEGEWFDGLPHGDGVLVFDQERDVRYEGRFVNGQRHGKGTMHYASGSTYVGEWKDDVKCGQGVMTWTESAGVTAIERYDGVWVGDRQHGFGRHVWLTTSGNGLAREKNWYEGEFRNGMRSGRGVFYYANGARYEGEWRDNVKDGLGIFFYEDGRVFVGRFCQDRPVGPKAPASPTNTTHSPGTSSNTGIILCIRDLFDPNDNAFAAKTRKAVEHAALRINSELRSLYRHWIKEVRRASGGSGDSDDCASVMEIFECRQLLSTCGLFLPSSQLENIVAQIRRAQRETALADAVTTSEDGTPLSVDALAEDLPLLYRVRYPADPVELQVVTCDQQLLFREFVELLVRLAFWRLTNCDPTAQYLVAQSGATVLADAVTDLFGQMTHERQKSQREPVTWLAQMRTQLLAKSMQIIFAKHRATLLGMFDDCCEPRENEDEDAANQAATVHSSKPPSVSIRSVLAMLRRVSPPQDPIFTDSFRIRDALQALDWAFAESLPESSNTIQTDDCNGNDRSDPFFPDSRLVFSEYLDAIAVVVYARRWGLQVVNPVDDAPSMKAVPEVELCALLDGFLQNLRLARGIKAWLH